MTPSRNESKLEELEYPAVPPGDCEPKEVVERNVLFNCACSRVLCLTTVVGEDIDDCILDHYWVRETRVWQVSGEL